MIDDRTLEAAARSWLEEGPRRAPVHAVDAALARIEVTPQERRLTIPWRLPRMSPLARAAAAAVVAVVVVGGSLYLIDRAPGIGGEPTPSIAPSGTPAPTADAAACALVTTAEAEQLVGTEGLGVVTSPSGTGDVVLCVYADGTMGDVLLRLSYRRTGGDSAMQAVRDTPGIEAVTDLGDEAIFDPAVGTLHVRSGDALLSIAAGSQVDAPADRLLKARSIADVAYPRVLAALPATPAPTADAAACALVTSEEAAELVGMLGMRPLASGTGNVVSCIYVDGGGEVALRLVLTKTGGDQALQATRDAAGVQVVEGQGDEAIFDPATGTLHVRKGDSLLSINAGIHRDAPGDPVLEGRSVADVAYPRM